MEKLKPVNERLAPVNIESYREGCAEIGLALHTAVNQVLKDGKKPTIIIPSRGAIPVFLIAYQQLFELDKQDLLAGPATRFYPDCIFEHLSAGGISQQNLPADKSVVDVVLYPFTADVSSKTDNNQARNLASQLRQSASQALLDLISGDRRSFDLNWYFFLMKKTELHFGNTITNSEKIIQSLKGLPSDKNRQVILIDTVVSGRAASDITGAFKKLGHPSISILAVNNLGGTKLQPRLRAEIYHQSQESVFIELPLITEDAGAALLGVTAINFSNFNQEKVFHQINPQLFPEGFFPQSCLWALPPLRLGQIYSEAFHAFLKYCLNPSEVPNWPEVTQTINRLISNHGPISPKEIRALVPTRQEARANESSSHIISIEFHPKQAADWIKEFERLLLYHKDII